MLQAVCRDFLHSPDAAVITVADLFEPKVRASSNFTANLFAGCCLEIMGATLLTLAVYV